MKAISLVLMAFGFTICQHVVAEHPIPPGSEARWDYRGQEQFLTNDLYAKLFKCETYEQLRDALIAAIEGLEHEPDDPTLLYVASDCRLALIRTYYLLGDIKNADRLLTQYSSVKSDSEGRLDLSKEPIRPLPIVKPGASNTDTRKSNGSGEAGTGQPATRSQSKSEGSDKPQSEAEGRSR